MSVEEDKATMRRAMRKRRRELATRSAAAAEAAANVYQPMNLPIHGVVALYACEGAELSADPLAHRLASEGMRIAVPVVVACGEPLDFQLVTDFSNPDVLPLLGAPPNAPRVSPDLIIVPLLAFDERGYRLGQGGGFYDRTLAALRRSTQPPLAIGLAYAAQKVDRVPTDAYDQRLDGVLTEAGFIDISGVG